MNKVEGFKGFVTFCLILIAIVLLFFSVRFIISKRTLKDESKASVVIPESVISSDNVLPPATQVPPVAEEPLSLQGGQQALSLQDFRYDLNKDGVVNMYDYYLLVFLLNQTPNNN